MHDFYAFNRHRIHDSFRESKLSSFALSITPGQQLSALAPSFTDTLTQ